VYNGFALKYSSREGWHYVDDKGNVGKLRTARGQKTSQTLGPARNAKVLLASGEMTTNDNDLAMAFSSGSKHLDDQIQELAARVMGEARKDPESVVFQDPWFSQPDWSPKKKTKRKEQEKPKAPAICWPKRYWDSTRPQKG
jgi:DNA polymerase gamma 1